MINKTVYTVLIAGIIVSTLACNYEAEAPTALPSTAANQNNLPVTSPSNSSQTCSLVQYSDTLFYLQNDGKDLKVKPLIPHKGYYGAYPLGLEINNSNGEINITKSESGLNYIIFFIPENTTDTCRTRMTLSGVDYYSKIYLLDKNENIAKPVYNGNPNLIIPGTSGNGNTEFDDGPDDDGDDQEPLAGEECIPQGLAISKTNGEITLNESLKKGLFGEKPKNGDHKKLKLNYRIDDGSKRALNKLEFEFHYYEKESDISKDIKDKVAEGQEAIRQATKGRSGGRIMFFARRPRPPHVVIVGRIQ